MIITFEDVGDEHNSLKIILLKIYFYEILDIFR
jgi:hypothetical protein